MTMSFDKPPFPRPDGRTARRKRVLLGGKIVYDDGAFSLDCAIRDLSESGARLGIRGATVLPKYFHLIDLRSGMAYDCEVIWRNATQTGVRFRSAVALAGLADPRLKHLRNFYVEAGLR